MFNYKGVGTERGASPSHIPSPSPTKISSGLVQRIWLERGIEGVRLRRGEAKRIEVKANRKQLKPNRTD